MAKKVATGFRIIRGTVFQIILPNGVTLSTRIEDNAEFSKENDCYSPYCEVAIWDKNHKWITDKMIIDLFGAEYDDYVKDSVTVKEWIKVFEWCRNYKQGMEGENG